MLLTDSITIEANPEILYGKPVIKGSRISIDLILEKMSFGQSFQEIIQSYPDASIHTSASPPDFVLLPASSNPSLLQFVPIRPICSAVGGAQGGGSLKRRVVY